jgi:glycosyltransferase involved in cell wall biosynthesis
VDDPLAWQEAILSLRDDHAARSSKIDAGYRRAARFTWKASGARLLQLLDRLSLQ